MPEDRLAIRPVGMYNTYLFYMACFFIDAVKSNMVCFVSRRIISHNFGFSSSSSSKGRKPTNHRHRSRTG